MFSETTVLTNFVVSPLVLLNQVWFNLTLDIRRQWIFITDFLDGGLSSNRFISKPNLTIIV